MINADFVEQALLGALLADTHRRTDIPWLRPADLTDPLCHALLTHLDNHLAAGGVHIDYLDIAEALRRDTQLHPRHAAPSRIAELHINAPVNPDVTAYARILLEVAIRNQVALLGIKLTQIGRQEDAAPTPADRHVLRELLQRYDQPGRQTVESIGSPGTPVRTRTPLDQFAQVVSDADLRDAQYATISAAVHNRPPGIRAAVLAGLHPDDFPDPHAAATYRAVQRLASCGEHIDEITVAWNTLRHHDIYGPGIPAADLAREPQSAAAHCAVPLLQRASQLRRVRQAGSESIREASNLRSSPQATAQRTLSAIEG